MTKKEWIINKLEQNNNDSKYVYKTYFEDFKRDFGLPDSYLLDTFRRYIQTTIASDVKNVSNSKDYSEKSSIEYKTDGSCSVSAPISVMSPRELMDYFKLNPDEWETKTFRANTWGENNRFHQSRADFIPKVVANMDDKIKKYEELLNEYQPKKYSPVKVTEGSLLEISIPDLHLGQLSWGQEIGKKNANNYDVDIAKTVFLDAVRYLLSRAGKNIEQILLPIGSDFFNVNNKENTTAHGTPQDEDCRWQKSTMIAEETCIEAIDMCRQIAPVKVVIIQGNHDEERSFYLGRTLKAWYRTDKYVEIDCEPKLRKYHLWGLNLIGMAHGDGVKMNDLPLIMADEVPELWSKTKYREWHIGHLHHNKVAVHSTIDEFRGNTVRIIPSLAEIDKWHYYKGYKALRQAQAFEWDKEKGLVAFYPFNV